MIEKSSQELIANLPSVRYKVKPKINNNAILISGGAGFLGIHLLKQLVLSKKYSTVYSIVRNIDKVLKQALRYNLNSNWLKNIHFIEGDLLDLNEVKFPDVEFVIHSAAQIHCIKTLKQLWRNNVESTERIAQIYQNNKVYFISTLSVFVSSNKKGIHKPVSLEVSSQYLLYGGYAQSKFIGEKIMEKYDHTIIRLGLMTGSSIDGIFPEDFFVNFIKMNYELGVYPEGFEQAFVDMTPVDYCVNNIMQKIIEKSQNTMHIANKTPTSLEIFIKILDLKKVTKTQWLEKIKSRNNLEQHLLKYAYFKSESLVNHFNYYNLDLFQTTGHQYSIENNFDKNNEFLLQLYCEKILRGMYVL